MQVAKQDIFVVEENFIGLPLYLILQVLGVHSLGLWPWVQILSQVDCFDPDLKTVVKLVLIL